MLRLAKWHLREWRALVVLVVLAALWAIVAAGHRAEPRLTITTVDQLIPVAFSPGSGILAGYRRGWGNVIEVCTLRTDTGDVIHRCRLGYAGARVVDLFVDFRASQAAVVLELPPALSGRHRLDPPIKLELVDLATGESLLPDNVPPATYSFNHILDVDWDRQGRLWPTGTMWVAGGIGNFGEPRTLLIDLIRKETRVLHMDSAGRLVLAPDAKSLVVVTQTLPQRFAYYQLEPPKERVRLHESEVAVGETNGHLVSEHRRRCVELCAAVGMLVQAPLPLPPAFAWLQPQPVLDNLAKKLSAVSMRPLWEFSWLIDKDLLTVAGLSGKVVHARRWDLRTGTKLEQTKKDGAWKWCGRQIPFFFEQVTSDACLCYDALAGVVTSVPLRETETSGFLSPYAFGNRAALFFDRHHIDDGSPLTRWVGDTFGWWRNARTTTRWVEVYERGTAKLICTVPRDSVLLMDPAGRQILTENERRQLEIWDFPVPGPPHAVHLLTAAVGALCLALVLFFLRRPAYLSVERFPHSPPDAARRAC